MKVQRSDFYYAPVFRVENVNGLRSSVLVERGSRAGRFREG